AWQSTRAIQLGKDDTVARALFEVDQRRIGCYGHRIRAHRGVDSCCSDRRDAIGRHRPHQHLRYRKPPPVPSGRAYLGQNTIAAERQRAVAKTRSTQLGGIGLDLVVASRQDQARLAAPQQPRASSAGPRRDLTPLWVDPPIVDIRWTVETAAWVRSG